MNQCISYMYVCVCIYIYTPSLSLYIYTYIGLKKAYVSVRKKTCKIFSLNLASQWNW